MILGYRISNRWAGNLLGQSYDDVTFQGDTTLKEDSAVIRFDLFADGSEPAEVFDSATVPLLLSVYTPAVEWYQPPFDYPIAHLATFNAPYEDPLDESGSWAKLDTASLNEVKKVDDGGGWGIAQSNGTGNAHAYWTQNSFGADTEVMFQPWDMPAGSFCYLWLCVQNEGTTTPSGYRLEIEFVSGSGDQWRLQKVVAGVVTTLATQAWSTGNADWAILRRVGDQLMAYEAYWTWDEELEIDADYPNLNDDYSWMPFPPNPEVGVFKYEIYDPVVSTTDSTIISEGRVGFGVNHIGGVRNFYAGDAYSVKEDTDEIYVNIGVRGYEGIEGEPSFFTFDTPESLDQWEMYWEDYSIGELETPQSHAVISNIVAVDGDASLRLRMDGDYPPGEFHMMWPDFVNGGDNTLDYWMTYAFYIESWASIEQGGLGGGFPLPGIQMQQAYDQHENWGNAPYLNPLSETTGQVSFQGSSVAVAEKDWHTVRFRWRQTGTQRVVKMYVNESVLYDATVSDTFGTPPMGIAMGNENNDTDGVVYIDAMEWSPGVEPTAPSTTETGLGTSTEQWLRIRDNVNGLSSYNSIELWELDEVDENGVPEAWLYAEVYIPQSYLDSMPSNEASAQFLETDAVGFFVQNGSGVNPARLSAFVSGSSGVSEKRLVENLEGNRWYRVEVHYLADTLTEIWIDNVLHSFPITSPGSVHDYTGYWSATQAAFVGSTHTNRNTYAWFGFDNLAWDDRGRVSDQQYRHWWSFEGKEALLQANLDYPDPPFYSEIGPLNYETSLEEGGYGPGPGLPIGVVYLTLSISFVEEVNLTTTGTAYLRMTPTGGVTYLDTPEVYVDLSVLGGECYSTFTAEQFGSGEATLKWSSTDNDRWTDEEDLRWTGAPALADTIHC